MNAELFQPHTLSSPIQSLDQTMFAVRVGEILATEKIEFDMDTLDVYVKANYPDLRKCINTWSNESPNWQVRKP